MAIRQIDFTVSANGISPSTEQSAGVQGEHNASELVFTLKEELYLNLISKKNAKVGNKLIYHFEYEDGTGVITRTDTAELIEKSVKVNMEEFMTENGGRAKVRLVITLYNQEDNTDIELISFAARIRYDCYSAPISKRIFRSITTYYDIAKDAAKKAIEAAAAAMASQEKTEIAQRAIEDETTIVFFDGGDAKGHTDVNFVIDDELSEYSDNAISNKAVNQKFREIAEESDEKYETVENKVDEIPANISETDAKKKFPSLKLIKNLITAWFPTNTPAVNVVVEQGTSGIWTYRKWSDGTAECWGIARFDTPSTTEYNGVTITEAMYFNYPFNFKKIDCVTATCSVASHFPTIMGLYSTTECGVRVNSTGNIYGERHVNFRVAGTWK